MGKQDPFHLFMSNMFFRLSVFNLCVFINLSYSPHFLTLFINFFVFTFLYMFVFFSVFFYFFNDVFRGYFFFLLTRCMVSLYLWFLLSEITLFMFFFCDFFGFFIPFYMCYVLFDVFVLFFIFFIDFYNILVCTLFLVTSGFLTI